MALNEFCRTELLVGEEGINKLHNSKVIVFGIGGVGSFVVEALTRAGVGNLILVDNDTICISNLNRQIHATQATVGNVKVEAMKERVLSINPNCNVEAKQVFITADNIEEIIPSDIDYVVDAIDTVTSKLALAEYCYKNNINIMSSMGTGNKMDPSQFRVTDVFKTKVCPLAKVMRYELKKRGVKKLKVVYSEEMPMKPDKGRAVPSQKRQTPGSISFVPPVAGMIIGGEVVKDLVGINS
ncbi:ThiF family adenylyltransferase [Clostridium celatum]|uniref:ThiF family protein n=1 Tax=Clostridium celatum DSM 1785 TaxID=545697 RepID=L1QP55_9CLOT|nr:tRNA threonylcarbamoyladenosine dehydratase [Clostridium celatum]EKY29332.1 ThiF family protein [Clostridium celatum DSM 1785]MCE9656189.1 tRNA threonylcarbamoyladenosine dehydratase [Clostridium celatum]MDU2265864.1 tRNA threonylcarbamoyladenosine dehydratase [Clostridium celatum]MDU3722836.1 tRNA threonylcarbamoyladenosine dehydratase [Clostridium celatum]MDU6297086.1 tRNA threonylcarbamoyladenosine dehydratase [Clostridium celatum]